MLSGQQLRELKKYWREHRAKHGCRCGMKFEEDNNA